LNVIEINPYGSELLNFFWRPLGLSYYQAFTLESQASPFEYRGLLAFFRPVRALALTGGAARTIADVEENWLDETDPSSSSSGMMFINHKNSVSADLFKCDATDSDEGLKFPSLHTDTPAGSAYYYQTSYGSKVIAVTEGALPSNVYVNGFATQSVASQNSLYAANYVTGTAKKHVRIANYAQTDRLYEDNLITGRGGNDNSSPTLTQVTDSTCTGTGAGHMTDDMAGYWTPALDTTNAQTNDQTALTC
jgi:hypothetical protein